MSVPLEARVAAIEKELHDLKESIGVVRTDKDWRKTFGMSANDPGFDEMIRLGAKIRREDRDREAEG